jgi:hypothetical protein
VEKCLPKTETEISYDLMNSAPPLRERGPTCLDEPSALRKARPSPNTCAQVLGQRHAVGKGLREEKNGSRGCLCGERVLSSALLGSLGAGVVGGTRVSEMAAGLRASDASRETNRFLVARLSARLGERVEAAPERRAEVAPLSLFGAKSVVDVAHGAACTDCACSHERA